MTPRHRDPRKEPQLHLSDLDGRVIERARAAVPRLSTEELVRIRGLLEAALEPAAGEGDGEAALRAAARALATDL